MANQIEMFGLNVHMHERFDCDDAHLRSKNLVEDSGLVVGSILTPNGPSTSKSIATPSDLYGEAKIAWEVLKVQLILRKHGSFIACCLSLAFFVVNDGNKPNPIILQAMCVICHFVCQNYSASNTAKRRKDMISYN
jgi:hypothetical protein